MNNVSPRWNPVSRSDQKDVLWDTSPYHGGSQPWEFFSKGNTGFFATGFEIYSSITDIKNLSLLARVMLLKKYTFIDKLYGESDIPDGGTSYQFFETHKRDTYKNETWMTGSIGLLTQWGPAEVFATLNLPLAYLAKKKTELHEDQALLFEHTIKNTWQVQMPTTLQILFLFHLGS